MARTYESGEGTTLYGDKLMLYINLSTTEGAEELVPIAFGTSCNIDINADTLDSTNKMSGNWKEALVGQLGWTVGSESLMSIKDGHLSFSKLKSIFLKRDPVVVVLGQSVPKDETADGADEFALKTEFVKGKAVITQLSITAQTGQFCTCSIQMQGCGALDEGTAVA